MNGSLSSSKRTKHIKARYYFAKDRIDEGEMDVRYCPTTEMWSDMLNKAKHGTPFKRDRAMLMNVPLAYDNELEFKNTHPALLTKGANLADIETQESNAPSRSVLGDIENVSPHRRASENKYEVSWAGIVRGDSVPEK